MNDPVNQSVQDVPHELIVTTVRRLHDGLRYSNVITVETQLFQRGDIVSVRIMAAEQTPP